MKKSVGIAAMAVAAAMITCNITFASTIREYTSTSSFDTAMGAKLNVEDFTNAVHYPITGGTLSSTTNATVANGSAITPGMILPGVTYSTPIGSGNFFNIDEGLYFTGGFLDRTSGGSDNNSDVALMTTFSPIVNGFGFLVSPLMGSELNVTINFTSGSSTSLTNLSIPTSGVSFYGFVSDATDIKSATIYGNDPSRPFAIDNFTYPELQAVPEPSSILDTGLAMLAGIGFMGNRRSRQQNRRTMH